MERLDKRRPEKYHVWLGPEFSVCDCAAGGYYHGKLPCKHLVAVKELKEDGHL